VSQLPIVSSFVQAENIVATLVKSHLHG